MASMQCQKPVEQPTNHQESAVICQKTTTQICQEANNEHSFTDKVKEVANSASKMLTDPKQPEDHGQNHLPHAEPGVAKKQPSINHESHGSHLDTAKTAATDKKKKKGHVGDFIANTGEHIKNMKKKKDKKKKDRKAGKHNDASSDSSSSSSSSSSSDDESHKRTSGKKKN